MIAWWWLLIAGSLGAILGFFLFCIFAVGGQADKDEKCEGDEDCGPCGGWY